MRRKTGRRIKALLFFAALALLLRMPAQTDAVRPVFSDAADSEAGEQKKIALSFDDGPHPAYTEQLLDGLKKRGVKAVLPRGGEKRGKA